MSSYQATKMIKGSFLENLNRPDLLVIAHVTLPWFSVSDFHN